MDVQLSHRSRNCRIRIMDMQEMPDGKHHRSAGKIWEMPWVQLDISANGGFQRRAALEQYQPALSLDNALPVEVSIGEAKPRP